MHRQIDPAGVFGKDPFPDRNGAGKGKPPGRTFPGEGAVAMKESAQGVKEMGEEIAVIVIL
jgi:hypothetical protein